MNINLSPGRGHSNNCISEKYTIELIPRNESPMAIEQSEVKCNSKYQQFLLGHRDYAVLCTSPWNMWKTTAQLW